MECKEIAIIICLLEQVPLMHHISKHAATSVLIIVLLLYSLTLRICSLKSQDASLLGSVLFFIRSKDVFNFRDLHYFGSSFLSLNPEIALDV